MAAINKNRLLVLGIVLLLVTNISTIIGIVWHLNNHEFAKPDTQNKIDDITNMPRGQFFKYKLDLDHEQTYIFRDLYHQYKNDAGEVSCKMDSLRKDMIFEMATDNPDSLALGEIAAAIGDLHKQLKELTIGYFLEMKKICNPEQEIGLHEIFNSLLNEQGDVRMPNPRGQRGLGRQRNERYKTNSPNNRDN
ncbi:MAG: periplasmic heavy metal sensor [Bacteroidota bacterium]|nr:periplasmic heavy metal sensor [Bacteroidota bacterium]